MDPKSLCFRETSHKWHFAAVTNVVFDLWWLCFDVQILDTSETWKIEIENLCWTIPHL
jgi:hypothetical protein